MAWNNDGIQLQGHLHVVQGPGERETAFTHRQFGEKGKETKAQLDHIIGPRWKYTLKELKALQVKMTNLLQKQWDWQEDRTPMLRPASVVRPTMYLASMDIKTTFDEARPRDVANTMEGHNTHGWFISALLREKSARWKKIG